MKSKHKDENKFLDKILGIYSKELSQSERSENSREIAKQILAKSKESQSEKVITTYQHKKPLLKRISFAYMAAAVVVISLFGVVLFQVYNDQDEIAKTQEETTLIEKEDSDIAAIDPKDESVNSEVKKSAEIKESMKKLDFMPLFLNTKAFSHEDNKETLSSIDRKNTALNICETILRDNNIILEKLDPDVYKSGWMFYKNNGSIVRSRLILKLSSDDEPGIKFYEEVSDIDPDKDGTIKEFSQLSYSELIIKIKKEYYKKIE